MRADFRKWWLDVKGSYWFIPSILTILAFLLSLLTVWLDRNGFSQWISYLGWYEPSRPEGARAQLTVVASAMIAISSTVFAITIAAVAYASGNYGPRLLTNFMNDRGNQVSLGVFIATFMYNMMVLRVVRDPQNGVSSTAEAAAFVPQISVLVSAVTMIVAVGVLVYFLHHIPASIRINSVIGGIGERLVRDIEKRFPDAGGAAEPPQPVAGEPVEAKDIGYIEIVDFGSLDDIARKNGVTLTLRVRTGDFVHPRLPLLDVCGGSIGEEVQEAVRAAFSIGHSRTPTQDLEFLIDELVEIGLRALSPGVNDPFTAVTAIHWLGAALAKLADRDLAAGPEQGDYDIERVRPIPDDFEHFVIRSFGSIRPSAAASPIASKMFVRALAAVEIGATSKRRRKILYDEGRRLLAQAETELKGPALDELRARLASWEAETAGSH